MYFNFPPRQQQAAAVEKGGSDRDCQIKFLFKLFLSFALN